MLETRDLVTGYVPAEMPSSMLEEPKIRYVSSRAVGRYVDILYDKWFKRILEAERKRLRRRRDHDRQYGYAPVYVVSFLDFSLHEGSDRVLYRYGLPAAGGGTDRNTWRTI